MPLKSMKATKASTLTQSKFFFICLIYESVACINNVFQMSDILEMLLDFSIIAVPQIFGLLKLHVVQIHSPQCAFLH
jgi:hypothetical protein